MIAIAAAAGTVRVRLYRAARRATPRPSFGVVVTPTGPDGRRTTRDTSAYATVG